MNKEDIDKIKMVKSQIKRAIYGQKWSISTDLRQHISETYQSITYLNSINGKIDMNDANIKIVVRTKFKYEDDNNSTPNRKVAISIKNGSYWQDFNALSYGFSKLELRILRWVLKYRSIEKDKLNREYLKQRSIQDLSRASEYYINENKSQFRDSKLEQILGDK